MRRALLVLSACLFTILSNATVRIVNSAASLSTEYTAAVAGDTLKFTANIVVSSTFAISKSIVLLGQGYTISVPSYGVTDGGALAASPSTFGTIAISGSNLHVRIIGLTVKGGSTATGGCILLPATDTLSLSNCVISNGRGTTAGGGIYSSGVVYMTRTVIKRNAASYGGGIVTTGAFSHMFLEKCTITENRSTSISGGGGGAAATSSAKLYINNSSFSSNQSTELGGGLTIFSASVGYIANSTFTGNVTYSDTYKGGGVQANGLSAQLKLVNCLFAYNYAKSSGSGGTPTAPTAFAFDDMYSFSSGSIDLYYCTYMSQNTTGGGTITNQIGNTAHLLATDGSTNDLFTGGVYTNMMGTDGAIYGTAKYFQPYLLNTDGLPQTTLRTSSYALNKGTATRFGYSGVTPRIGYYNKGTSAWIDLTGITTVTDLVSLDQGSNARPTLPAYPAVGAVERIVDNYFMLKVFASANGVVNGASTYGDLYPSGESVSFSALPNNGYAFTNFTSVEGTSGTLTSNPATVTMTENKSFNMNFTTTTSFTVTYLPNEATSGTVPSASQSYASGAIATIAANTGSLERTNFTFAGWNTEPNGSGSDYPATGASTYTSSSSVNLILYAKWNSTGVPLITLPVRLLDYEVKLQSSGAALIQWTVVNDDNTNHFQIERSANGSDFTGIGSIQSQNFLETKTYQYADVTPFAGKTYYRVVAVLADGKKEYYPIKVVVKSTASHFFSQLYPNPVGNSNISIEIYGNDSHSKLPYSIIDVAGRVIHNGYLLNKTVNTVDVSSLRAGTYFIAVYLQESQAPNIHKLFKR